jgi:hypothetical protein
MHGGGLKMPKMEGRRSVHINDSVVRRGPCDECYGINSELTRNTFRTKWEALGCKAV